MISSKPIESFTATVTKVYTDYKDLPILVPEEDYIPVYNNNKEFYSNQDTQSKKNISWLGAIEWDTNYAIDKKAVAFPFDKNNITYPIEGETIIILKLYDTNNTLHWYWLPYSRSIYPNYRQDYINTQTSKVIPKDDSTGKIKTESYREVSKTGTTEVNTRNQKDNQNTKNTYNPNETIKFLKPYKGDTIIAGRSGNSIRITQTFRKEENTPSIVIRNRQSSIEDTEPIGKLVEEDINNDGSSIYLTSFSTIVPFKETTQKQKIAFKNYPVSKDLQGDQIFLNSDRVILSSKAKEFIIFGKSNTGVITDGNFSIDSKNTFYADAENGIEFSTKGDNSLIFTPDNSGRIYIGKKLNGGKSAIKIPPGGTRGNVSAEVQQMVLGNALVDTINKLCQAIIGAIFTNSGGPAKLDPGTITNIVTIQQSLTQILSNRNFLSK